MVGAIKVNRGNIVLNNIGISGFDNAISAEDSQVQMSKMRLNNNRIGLDLKNSQSIIVDSDISNNVIDIVSQNSSVQIVDSIVRRIIIDGLDEYISTQPVSLRIDPFKIKAQAIEILKTRDQTKKKQKFHNLLQVIWKHSKEVATFYTILKTIAESFGINLP